jgi:hypothetical protein
MSHSRSPFGDWQSYLRSVFERDAAWSDTVASTVMVEIRQTLQRFPFHKTCERSELRIDAPLSSASDFCAAVRNLWIRIATHCCPVK